MTLDGVDLRQAAQADGGEEVDGEARVLGAVAREEALEEHRQRPVNIHHHQASHVVWLTQLDKQFQQLKCAEYDKVEAVSCTDVLDGTVKSAGALTGQ